MKKNMMRKNLRRSIKKSMGRYIAIAAIIALGSGLFCGLRVTKKDMVATLQDYADTQNMFDVRVMNTYGWTEDSVQALARAEGIGQAEGSISIDALMHMESGDDKAYKIMSIPERINCVKLEAGRLPQQGNECLADSLHFDSSVIGQQIRVSPDNEDSAIENLAYESYTIVGLASTPLYMNMQRGSTSIGSGSLFAFLYIPLEGFSLEYYTEINLTLDGQYAVYTDQYDNAMDDMAEQLETFTQPLADRRRTESLAEPEAEYADGLAQYQDGLAEYQKEKADALAQLEEAEQKLLDAEQELADNEQTLLEAKNQLYAAQETLDENKASLEEGRAALELERGDVYSRLDQAQEELTANQQLILQSQEQMEAGLNQIIAGLQQYDPTITQPEQAEAYLQSSISQLDSAVGQLSSGIGQYDSAISSLQDNLEQLRDAGAGESAEAAALEQQLQTLRAEREEYASQLASLTARREETGALLTRLQQLLQTRSALSESMGAIESGFSELNATRARSDEAFAQAQAQLLDAQAQIEEGQRQIDSQWEQWSSGMEALENGRQELADGWKEYEEKQAEAQAEFEKAERELADAQAELQDARKELDEVAQAQVYVLTRNTNIGYVLFENDSDIVAGVAKIFPAFFLAVAALVCITTMTRMVDEERTQIGILKALGYGRFAIMGKYLAYAGTSAILGCTVGVVLGSVIFPRILWTVYNIMYHFREQIILTFDYATCAGVLLSYTGLVLLVTWYCCRQELKDVPAELIRPKAPAAGKQILLERLPVWKKLKFLDKVAIRNIFRYRQRLAMMLLGIGGCTALLVTGFGIRDSIADIVSYQFESVTTYDIGVTFSDSQTAAQQDAFREEFDAMTENILFCHMGSIDVEYDGSFKNMNFISTDESLDPFFDLHSGSAQLSMPETGECLLSIGAADAMGISVGDCITLRSPDLEEMQVTVSGIFDNHVYNYAIVTGQTLREQWGHSPEIQTAFVINSAAQEVHELGAAISDTEGVINVTVNQDIADQVGNMMKALDAVVALVVICAGALAVIVLYNLTNINIKERVREIATIKVLGFNDIESGLYVFKENLVLTIMGTLLGLGGGKLLHAVVMSYVRIDMVWFSNRINWYSYIWAAVLTVLAALIVDFIMYFRLDRINMAEALKSVE